MRNERNAALACATVHHSSHLGLSSVQSPHAFCTILAFSIHSFSRFLIQSVISSALHCCACLLKKNQAVIHAHIQKHGPRGFDFSFFFYLAFALRLLTNAVKTCGKQNNCMHAHTHTRPHSKTRTRVDSCSWFCRRYAKSTSEKSKSKKKKKDPKKNAFGHVFCM